MRIRPSQLNNNKKPKLTIELCIHCFNYQRRLCWMLSSILQQKGDIPNIIINISHAPNQGNPTTEDVCKFFIDKGLNIKETLVTLEQVNNRAIARNIQGTQTNASWILFADCDLVYDPYFFEDLQLKLRNELKDVKVVLGADRISLNIDFCIKYFEEDKREYPCVIDNPAEISSKFPIKWTNGKDVAPGFFQLANVQAFKEKLGGKVTGNNSPRDVWRRTRADRQFRVGMGGRQAIRNIKPQYHLNHDRGAIDIQR